MFITFPKDFSPIAVSCLHERNLPFTRPSAGSKSEAELWAIATPDKRSWMAMCYSQSCTPGRGSLQDEVGHLSMAMLCHVQYVQSSISKARKGQGTSNVSA